jgi:CheY-like chemotaxis protein
MRKIVDRRPLALAIDDSEDTLASYAFALELEGFRVEEARNGREGLQKAVDLRPDIIITDLSMPIMDGWETIRRLRADGRSRHIPIIVCSGWTAGGGLNDTSADVLLPKPCPLDMLLFEVRRLVHRRAA